MFYIDLFVSENLKTNKSLQISFSKNVFTFLNKKKVFQTKCNFIHF